MASRNAMGFLGGFLEAANEDSKRRQTQKDKQLATRQALMAKRKEMMFLSKVKDYEKIKTLHASLEATPDAVARQNILSKYHGVDAASAQGKPIAFKVPELGADPRAQLDDLEGKTVAGRSPLITKMRQQIKNLGITMGWEGDKPTAKAPVTPSPVSPAAAPTPTPPQFPAPSQEAIDLAYKPPTKANIQLVERDGKFFAVDKNNLDAGAKEVKGLPVEAEGFKWQLVETETIDPETQETTVELQAVRIDEKTGETILGSNKITKKVKALKSAKDIVPKPKKAATKAELSHAKGYIKRLKLGAGFRFDLSDQEIDTIAGQQASEFLDALDEFAGTDKSRNEIETIALGRTVARYVPIAEAVSEESLKAMGAPVDSEGNINPYADANIRMLKSRIDANLEEFADEDDDLKAYLRQFE